MNKMIIVLMLCMLSIGLLATASGTPQNDIAFIMGLGLQGDGDLQEQLTNLYISEGWEGDAVPSIWSGFDLGVQLRTYKNLFLTPGFRILQNTVKKTVVYEYMNGYSEDKSDWNVILMPSIVAKYVVFNHGMHSVTVNGMLSKPSWVFGPEENFDVESDGVETGLCLGYEIDTNMLTGRSGGMTKSGVQRTTHIAVEVGVSSLPMLANRQKSNYGGAFLKINAIFGINNWK